MVRIHVLLHRQAGLEEVLPEPLTSLQSEFYVRPLIARETYAQQALRVRVQVGAHRLRKAQADFTWGHALSASGKSGERERRATFAAHGAQQIGVH